MKYGKMIKKISLILLLLTSYSFADAEEGKKLYVKNLKMLCSMSGLKFTSTHSQDEWEEIFDAGEYVNELKKLCPKIKSSYKKEWTSDLYKFSYKYANDSDNVPNC